jgi:hypothetical protein
VQRLLNQVPINNIIIKLWESLDKEEQVQCWKMLEQEKGWVVWCRANPGKIDKEKQAFRHVAVVSLRVSASRLRLTSPEKKHQEANM